MASLFDLGDNLLSAVKRVRDRAVPAAAQADITAIGDRLFVCSHPARAPLATYDDDGRDDWHVDRGPRPSALSPQPSVASRRSLSSTTTRQSPMALAAWLDQHAPHHLVFSLSDEPLDDRARLLLRRQWVQLPWKSPGQPASSTPTIPGMLAICYAMDAWLSINGHTAVVSCENGKTRSAMAIACYLKFKSLVETTRDGFCVFCERRCRDPPEALVAELPASLQTFFGNFDSAIELGRYVNRQPLLLRAIALQGMPVEDQPCLDLYNARGEHVYSSHAEHAPTSQWVEEEGFYRVNTVLEGDFCLLCRFGGDHAGDEADASKIIFRYANTTGFCGVGTYELPASRVDLMRRYRAAIEDDEFLLSLVLEAHWNCLDEQEALLLRRDCAEDVLPPIYSGQDALEEGWHVITSHHLARPVEEDVRRLRDYCPALSQCPSHIVRLVLQLHNFEAKTTASALLTGPWSQWWRNETIAPPVEPPVSDLDDEAERQALVAEAVERRTARNRARKQAVLSLLDEVDLDENKTELPSRLGGTGRPAHEGRRKEHGASFPYESPILNPHAGDLMNAIGGSDKPPNYLMDEHAPLELGAQPIFPIVPRTGYKLSAPMALEHPDNRAAAQLFMQLNHAGVSLQDLLHLLEVSRQWNKPEAETEEAVASDKEANESTKDETTAKARQPGAVDEVPAGEPPLKEDPKYEKYFRMLSKGLPDGAVRNALVRDGLDPSTLDLDPEKSLVSQMAKEEDKGDEPALKDDPKYEKYFRMLAKGLPDGAVRNALVRDGLDPTILDLNPDESLASQTRGAGDDAEPALKDDPKYEKYFRMLEKGLPDGAVRNALVRDDLDPSILDLDPEKSLVSQTSNEQSAEPPTDDGPPLKDDPIYEKYFRMLSKGLPDGAVRNALTRDGLDPSVLDLDPEKSLASQRAATRVSDGGPALKDDPVYEKYFRMREKGLPEGAVRNALMRDGLDPSVMDFDPHRSLASQKPSTPAKDTGIPLCDDPEWTKYFKMLAMGLPMGAVKNAVQRDGLDPAVMDLDPSKSLVFQMKSSRRRRASSMMKKKKRVRRKKIYWNPIDPGQVKEDSLWSLVRGKVSMSHLKYDVKEFEDLFTESAEPADQKHKKATSTAAKTKKAVQVIDGKRSMNGGIILLRLRMDYKKIAHLVDNMEHGNLDSTQLKALKEFLPTVEEKNGLLTYNQQAGATEEKRREAYADLSECEKYMLTMVDVADAAEKFDCLLFRVQFKNRLDELMNGVRVVEQACNEVRNSQKLREIMAMILTLVNEINTGGDGNEAIGFSLDALLKLNEAKAFDRKTSVLHYLVRLVKSNDAELCDFGKDLVHVPEAQGIILDSLISEFKALQEELVGVHETAKQQADRLAQAGEVQQVSLQELKEQRTSIRSIERVPQYNQMDHLTGRTSMERFTIGAKKALESAAEFADQVEMNYSKLLEFLCEDEGTSSNEFFGLMWKFVTEFNNAVEQVNKEEKAKRREEKRSAAKSSPSSKPIDQRPDRAAMANLAFLAAQKAQEANKGEVPSPKAGQSALSSQPDEESTGDEMGSPMASSGGGMASMDRVVSDHPGPGVSARSSNIAAMAAAAAAARTSKHETELSPGESDLGIGGIATLAAAAAAARRKKNEPESSPVESAVSPGGIAAMAAAAAAARMKKNEPESSPVESAVSPGGIAAMAAAAAAARMKKNEPESSPVESAVSPGGIAAVAAAAARMKKNEPESSPSESAVSPGGIAALAAAAAARSNRSAALSLSPPVGGESEQQHEVSDLQTGGEQPQKIDASAESNLEPGRVYTRHPSDEPEEGV